MPRLLFLLAAAAVSACASYRGSAVDASLAELRGADGWTVVADVALERQRQPSSCGAAALAMVLRHHGLAMDQTSIEAAVAGERARAGELRDFARAQGLAAFVFSGELEILRHEIEQGRPVIVGLIKPFRQRLLSHYEVVVGVNVARGEVATLDPARGWRRNSFRGFLLEWEPANRIMIAILPLARAPGIDAALRRKVDSVDGPAPHAAPPHRAHWRVPALSAAL